MATFSSSKKYLIVFACAIEVYEHDKKVWFQIFLVTVIPLLVNKIQIEIEILY